MGNTENSSDKKFFVVVTDRGLAETASAEISEILGDNLEIISKTDLTIGFRSSFEDACKLCYKAQSIRRCMMLIAEARISADLKESLALLSELIKKEEIAFLESRSFRVECERMGTHTFSSIDFARGITKILLDKTDAYIDFKNPRYIIFCCIIDNCCFLGLDLAAFDLGKREYRIFNHPNSLKSTIAYALFRMAVDTHPLDRYSTENASKNASFNLLNLFCKSGIIAIEAAIFFSKFPVNFFRKDAFSFLNFDFVKIDFERFFSRIDSEIKNPREKFKIFASDPLMRNLSAAKKNAKIAGVEKMISFSRNDLEWLDIRFGKQDIDVIISDLTLSKREDSKKFLGEFFGQCHSLLKNDGVIAMIFRDEAVLREAAPLQNFRIIEHQRFWQGQQQLDAYLISRNR